MNRAQRRRAQKAKPWAAMTPEQKTASLFKNGITDADVKRSYEEGFHMGYQRGLEYAVKTCYAGFALAMNDILHFGQTRVMRVLRCADKKIVYALSSEEAIDEVYEKLKFRLDFNAPMMDERIVEKDG